MAKPSTPVIYYTLDVTGEHGDFWVLEPEVAGQDYEWLLPKACFAEVIQGWSPWVVCVGSRVRVNSDYLIKAFKRDHPPAFLKG